jgi:hypothetical protein
MSEQAPSLVPSFDVIVHIVLDDFGKLGRSLSRDRVMGCISPGAGRARLGTKYLPL